MKQNIYDNEDFFSRYLNARSQSTSYNTLYEIPCMEGLLPDVRGLNVLDVGCGSGTLALKIAEMGANHVLGIDISSKQIRLAQSVHIPGKLDFNCIAIEDFFNDGHKFDLIVSSLAFHYIDNYEELLSKISTLVAVNGTLLFSTEHPFVTCYPDKNESKMDALKKYKRIGRRNVDWHGAKVVKYHRTIETLINSLIKNGFVIEDVCEPCELPVIIVIKSKLKTI